MLEEKYENEIRIYEKWFGYYLKLPIITSVFWGIVFFVLPIVLATMEISYLILWIPGALLAMLNYYLTQVLVSSKILKVLYLMKLSQGSVKVDTDKENTVVDLSKEKEDVYENLPQI